MPDKWIRVRPNSHRDSAKTDDRPLEPRTVALRVYGVGWNGKKHLTFIPLFVPNFRSFWEILEIRPGTTTNHHNEFAISIFGIQNTPRVHLYGVVRCCGGGGGGWGSTRQRPTKSCEKYYLWCSRYIIIAVPLPQCCIYIMFTLVILRIPCICMYTFAWYVYNYIHFGAAKYYYPSVEKQDR